MEDKAREEILKELQDLKRENEKLKKSHSQLQNEARLDEKMLLKLLKAVNTISDAIFLTDTDGIIIYKLRIYCTLRVYRF
jgi:PAS domain-containing protein